MTTETILQLHNLAQRIDILIRMGTIKVIIIIILAINKVLLFLSLNKLFH